MEVDVDEFLEHYGVPGMKWGRRKASSMSTNRSLNKASRKNDRKKPMHLSIKLDFVLKVELLKLSIKVLRQNLRKIKQKSDKRS